MTHGDGFDQLTTEIGDSTTEQQAESAVAHTSKTAHHLEHEARTKLYQSAKAVSYIPVTETVTFSADSDCTDLLKVAEKCSNGRFSSYSPTYLVGLHACGDLTPTALRLYHKLPTVQALCIVGCCYQHVTEGCEDGE